MFGYEELPDALASWDARAIFHPRDEFPLDFLPDRQDFQCALPDEGAEALYAAFRPVLCGTVLPRLQKVAGLFRDNEDRVFTLHFDWPHDDEYILVAQGSPRASYGYFYLAVNLIRRELAPAMDVPALSEGHRMRGLQGAPKRRRYA